MKNTKGFTLMEILTVLVIIGVLVGVAFPQYRRVMVKSQITEAVAILHDLRDSSERLAVARGYRAYANLLAAEPGNAKLPNMDLFNSSSRPKGCSGNDYILTCLSSSNAKKAFSYKVDGSFVAAKKTNNPYKDTYLVLLRSDGQLYCKGAEAACDLFGFPAYSGSVSF